LSVSSGCHDEGVSAKSVRSVRGREEVIAVVGLQHRRVAIAGEDLRRDIVGQQRLPRRGCLGEVGAVDEEVRKAGSEVVVELPEEFEVILRLPAIGQIAG